MNNKNCKQCGSSLKFADPRSKYCDTECRDLFISIQRKGERVDNREFEKNRLIEDLQNMISSYRERWDLITSHLVGPKGKQLIQYVNDTVPLMLSNKYVVVERSVLTEAVTGVVPPYVEEDDQDQEQSA